MTSVTTFIHSPLKPHEDNLHLSSSCDMDYMFAVVVTDLLPLEVLFFPVDTPIPELTEMNSGFAPERSALILWKFQRNKLQIPHFLTSYTKMQMFFDIFTALSSLEILSWEKS